MPSLDNRHSLPKLFTNEMKLKAKTPPIKPRGNFPSPLIVRKGAGCSVLVLVVHTTCCLARILPVNNGAWLPVLVAAQLALELHCIGDECKAELDPGALR